MDLCLQRLMKWRFKLTRITANESNNVEVTDGFEIDTEEVIVTKSKYSPPIFYKEHALSHLMQDICNIGPSVLTNTDTFESKHRPLKGPFLDY